MNHAKPIPINFRKLVYSAGGYSEKVLNKCRHCRDSTGDSDFYL